MLVKYIYEDAGPTFQKKLIGCVVANRSGVAFSIANPKHPRYKAVSKHLMRDIAFGRIQTGSCGKIPNRLVLTDSGYELINLKDLIPRILDEMEARRQRYYHLNAEGVVVS